MSPTMGNLIAGCLCSAAMIWGDFAATAGEIRIGKPLAVSAWTVDDGLAGNAVWSIAPTQEGYLWVAGLNGIARFDGVRFVRLKAWDGLPSLAIQHVVGDRHRILWVGTEDAGVAVAEH